MKPEFQAKFLQHLNKKKSQEGFTLIELLVVIIIIGILAAIALPSLLGQVNKAKQSEARNNIGALNRAQQATYLEFGNFSTDTTLLGIAISGGSGGGNYIYTIKLKGDGQLVNNVANANTNDADKAPGKTLKSYLGIVGTVMGDSQTSEALTVAAACESIKVGGGGVVAVTGDPTPGPTPGKITCPGEYRNLSGNNR